MSYILKQKNTNTFGQNKRLEYDLIDSSPTTEKKTAIKNNNTIYLAVKLYLFKKKVVFKFR